MKLLLAGALGMLLLLLNHNVLAQDTARPPYLPLWLSARTNSYRYSFAWRWDGHCQSKGCNPETHFLSSRSALEFNLTPGGRNIITTTLVVLRHFPVLEAPQLQWYAGTGINFDLYRYARNPSPPDSVRKVVANTTTVIGVLGAEYRLPKLPFTISGDIKKGVIGFTHLGTEKRYNLINGLRPSLSFRYTFPK